MVITASTRNRVIQRWVRGFESHRLRQFRTSLLVRFYFAAGGFEGAGVNDSPVGCQSRPRPSPQARIESHRLRHIPHEFIRAVLFFIKSIQNQPLCRALKEIGERY